MSEPDLGLVKVQLIPSVNRVKALVFALFFLGQRAQVEKQNKEKQLNWGIGHEESLGVENLDWRGLLWTNCPSFC